MQTGRFLQKAIFSFFRRFAKERAVKAVFSTIEPFDFHTKVYLKRVRFVNERIKTVKN